MSDNQNLISGYELKNCVATGATTQIWEVTQQGATIPFAMKLLLPDALKNPEAKNVLRREFKIGAQLEHPGIIRFHKIEVTRDHGFFIMDYFRAPSLKAQISGNLAETQSRFKRIAESILQAYVYMNEKGWLHRDIKPDNILVNKTGEVRIIDFSLATRVTKGIMKMLAGKQKSIMGTRTYIAPEIILKNPPSIQSDIYSLGITFYEIITGTPPFAGLSPSDLLKKHIGEAAAPPSSVNPNVTSELDAVVLKMLAKKPKDRYAEMREVMSALRNVRCFTEDPAELHERRVKERAANESLSVDKRLDSRADADRVARGVAAPLKAVKAKRLTAPIGDMEPVKKAGAKSPANPAAAMPTAPMMVPGVPYGMPPVAMPGMVYPGMIMQPGQQPMMPQMPQYPGGMMPGQMMPGQMMPGQMMPVVPPATGQQMFNPVSPPPSAGAPPIASPQAPSPQAPAPAAEAGEKKPVLPLERRTAKPAAPEEVENLDFMTELPDIT